MAVRGEPDDEVLRDVHGVRVSARSAFRRWAQGHTDQVLERDLHIRQEDLKFIEPVRKKQGSVGKDKCAVERVRAKQGGTPASTHEMGEHLMKQAHRVGSVFQIGRD